MDYIVYENYPEILNRSTGSQASISKMPRARNSSIDAVANSCLLSTPRRRILRRCRHQRVLLGVMSLAILSTCARAGGQEAGSQAQPQRTEHSSAEHERAEREIKQEEKQRILGVIPNFNTSYVQNAAPLTVQQKFQLAFRSAIDPFSFVAAGLVAGIEQWNDAFPGYGQGAEGYGKRFGAAYADAFNGTILGNAVFPSLLRQDPRYFRKGSGRFGNRLFYAIASTVRTRNDSGKWAPNYSNVLGNMAAGGIANVYYPSTDRGVALTFQRAFTVTAEGALGSIFVEFWPDISKKLFGDKRGAGK